MNAMINSILPFILNIPYPCTLVSNLNMWGWGDSRVRFHCWVTDENEQTPPPWLRAQFDKHLFQYYKESLFFLQTGLTPTPLN